MGAFHICAPLNDGSVYCWDISSQGLGTEPPQTPKAPPSRSFSSHRDPIATGISSGESHPCALMDNGTIYCWGKGANGRLGNGDTNDRRHPDHGIGNIGRDRKLRRRQAHMRYCDHLDRATAGVSGKKVNSVTGIQRDIGPIRFWSVGNHNFFIHLPGHRPHLRHRFQRRRKPCWGASDSGKNGRNSDISEPGDVTLPGVDTVKSIAVGDSAPAQPQTTEK